MTRLFSQRFRVFVAAAAVAGWFPVAGFGDDAAPAKAQAAKDAVIRWTFDGESNDARLKNGEGTPLVVSVKGKPQFNVPGPQGKEYPDFSAGNLAVRIPTGANYLIVKDPGEDSALDFTVGDSITLESWVRWDEPLRGGYGYIIGKGRTQTGPDTMFNQNYALRVANESGGVYLNFLFATPAPEGEKKNAWHRWTSTDSVPEDGAWHHVAVTYTFGKADSVRGYVDGVPVKGKWDMDGPTDKAPVVDNDDVWIGSSMSGQSTFTGYLDGVAIHRRAISGDEFKKLVRINIEASGEAVGKVDAAVVPADHVRVELLEGLPIARSWKVRVREPELVYETDLFALKELPRKYNSKGLAVDRKVPSLLHLSSKIELPAGEYEFIVRSLDSARLYIDGELLAETAFMGLSSDAHNTYYDLPDFGPNLLSMAAGHSEKRVTVRLDGGPHVISLYRLLGNKGKGDYFGELCVGFGPPGGPYRFVGPKRELAFTDAGWLTFLAEHEIALRDWEQNLRDKVSGDEQDYWRQRRAFTKSVAKSIPAPQIPDVESKDERLTDIDRFLLARLVAEGKQPAPLTDDMAFLRRVTLDVHGVIPTPEQIERFFKDPPETRRQLVIDRLMADPAWADHWVGYWQDVLAENPGLTKPELNNTGPFRWYLYDAMLDNRPLDRFVTELVMMEGSRFEGAPAAFGIASQNDVPMAAKAHILGTAFLGVEMKCARCHDAPYHDLKQEDLFSLAAMLRRSPQDVPGTSTVPLSPEQLAKSQVKVTLMPGTSVKPAWPFVELLNEGYGRDASAIPVSVDSPLPPELYRAENDSREQLAAQITSPHNSRFARVLANRIWKQYMGRAFIEPVEDWEGGECSHPELLDYLARELVLSGYDLKHLARLILNSQAYQREAQRIPVTSEQAALFAGPVRRRMTGEQLADSLYLASGKDYSSEELTMDRDGRQSLGAFTHMRYPRRAWQFVTVSNERDRPSLNLPVAQSLIDLMTAYGWRQQRQDPLTVREDVLTPLTPMALAHGTASNRVIDFSDHSEFTSLALENQPVERFIERLFQRLLTRSPTADERQAFVELLSPGYDQRIVAGPEAVQPRRIFRSGTTWTNHFDPKSDDEAITRQREILNGDPPTARLDADWRSRAEDATWVLVNLPEFLFIP